MQETSGARSANKVESQYCKATQQDVERARVDAAAATRQAKLDQQYYGALPKHERADARSQAYLFFLLIVALIAVIFASQRNHHFCNKDGWIVIEKIRANWGKDRNINT